MPLYLKLPTVVSMFLHLTVTQTHIAEKVKSGKFDNFVFHWRDDPRKDDEWYEKQKEKLDPVTLAQEIDIDFAASVEGVLIPSRWVQSAVDSHIKLGFNPRGERKAALDVADKGKDKNALTIRDGVLIESCESWHGKVVEDIFGTTQKAIDICADAKVWNLTYDSDGMGVGVRGDARVINETRSSNRQREIILSAYHASAEIEDKENEIVEGRTNGSFFLNYKAQCWWGLRDRFKKTYESIEQGKEYPFDELISISSNCSSTLISELSQPTYSKNGQGKIVIDKAPDDTMSPNEADSVMMAFEYRNAIDYGALL